MTLRKNFLLRAGDWVIPLGSRTQIMGIINVTPDSFSRDGIITRSNKKNYHQYAWAQAQRLIKEGAHIIDIGGESSRPGSTPVSVQEEIRRITPLITRLRTQNTVPISVDTYKTSVAQAALDAGANIINNIYGIKPKRTLLKMVRDYDAAIVLMHMRQTPKTMQKKISYNDVTKEIFLELKKTIGICLEIGIKSDKIIIDPGIGFGKMPEHNLEIINKLRMFQRLGQPILIGTSRKSFIGKILGKDVHERLMGTAATVTASILQGAHIVRIHDVKELKNTIVMTDAILSMKVDQEL